MLTTSKHSLTLSHLNTIALHFLDPLAYVSIARNAVGLEYVPHAAAFVTSIARSSAKDSVPGCLMRVPGPISPLCGRSMDVARGRKRSELCVLSMPGLSSLGLRFGAGVCPWELASRQSQPRDTQAHDQEQVSSYAMLELRS